MKRSVSAIAVFLALAAAPLFALDSDRKPAEHERTVIDDVIRMAQAGVADEAIIAFVRTSRERFEVTADDVIAMTEANVSKDVIKAVVDAAADRKERRDRTYIAPAWYGPYDPWFWGSPLYDPWWYTPRLHVGFTFGPRYEHVRPLPRGGHHRRR